MHNSYTDEKVNEIIKLHDSGKTPTEISKIYKTYNTTIRRILLANGRDLKSISETLSTIKENPFKDVNSYEVQYWLGLLSADGNLSTKGYRINLSLQEKDLYIVEAFKSFLQSNNKIQTYYGKYITPVYSLNVKNKDIHTFLTSLGITPNKSKTLEVNFPITWSFIKGVIDGDGYVRKNGLIEIATASEKFAKQLLDFFNTYKIKTTKSVYNNIHIVRISALKDCYFIYTKLYENKTTFMTRKYERFGSLAEKFANVNTANSGKVVEQSRASEN
jgi:DNA-binding transcriptional regulator WhiA